MSANKQNWIGPPRTKKFKKENIYERVNKSE